ncbi:MAG: VWA domain-containing protein [Candidatus Thiodiazotropha lotti]|nr:VWA domain-containing protein [Candidatus Thiodiazotropha lotti]
MKTQRNTTLRNSLPAVCSAIAGRKGVKIIWNGPPRTEGSTIWSNPLPIDADEDTRKMVVGDIDHEIGHIRYSDFDYLNAKSGKISPLQQSIWNALEDTFEERRMGDDYVGCRQTLAESTEIAIREGHCRTGEKGPADALATFCDAWGRKNVLLQAVDPVLNSAHRELIKYIEEKGVARLEALLSTKLFSADSTDDTYRLSEEVIRLMQDIREEQEQRQNQPKQQSDRNQDGNTGGNDTGSQNGDDQSGNPGQTDSNPDSGEGSAGPNSIETDAGNGAGHGGSAHRILEDTNVSTAPVIDRRGAVEEMSQAVASGSFIFDPNTIRKPDHSENLPRYIALKASISGSIALLQRRLAVEFQTRRHSRTVISEEGRLDGRRLHQAILGNPRVCRKKQVIHTPKPAVSLVLDSSGSMGMRVDSKIELATQAVIALAEVCEAMGVPCEVVTYGGSQIGSVKTFDIPLAKARKRIGAIGAGGGTPTAEALWIAGNRLFNRKEGRKILMLVTDGKANDMPNAAQVANMIERSGIELYGIGLGTEVIRQVCNKAGVVNKADDLAPAILNALASRMLAAAA